MGRDGESEEVGEGKVDRRVQLSSVPSRDDLGDCNHPAQYQPSGV